VGVRVGLFVLVDVGEAILDGTVVEGGEGVIFCKVSAVSLIGFWVPHAHEELDNSMMTQASFTKRLMDCPESIFIILFTQFLIT
jgi:hypothetical protein